MIAEEVRGLAVRRNGGPAETAEPPESTALAPYGRSTESSAFRFLKSLRALAPDSKNWG